MDAISAGANVFRSHKRAPPAVVAATARFKPHQNLRSKANVPNRRFSQSRRFDDVAGAPEPVIIFLPESRLRTLLRTREAATSSAASRLSSEKARNGCQHRIGGSAPAVRASLGAPSRRQPRIAQPSCRCRDERLHRTMSRSRAFCSLLWSLLQKPMDGPSLTASGMRRL